MDQQQAMALLEVHLRKKPRRRQLLIHLVRNQKLGGDTKAKLLSMEQQGVLAHQAMGLALIDSDGRPKSKQLLQRKERIQAYLTCLETEGVAPKKRGRPTKVLNGCSSEKINVER